jgi:hypothetical protein
MNRTFAWFALGGLLAALPAPTGHAEEPALEIGTRRELFVDSWLIARLDGAHLALQQPRDEGPAFAFDKPWEGLFSGYCTMIYDNGAYRAYYRGSPLAKPDGSSTEVTCVAESTDGVHWTKPKLGLFEVCGTRHNNVVLAGAAPHSHNFSPLVDHRPGCPASERYKALAGTMESGLAAFASADGLRWRKLRAEPVLVKERIPFRYMFDSQNLAFWSASEKRYVCYFRVFEQNIRRICRTESPDFLTWTPPVLMEYRTDGQPSPLEHLYTNQTHPYFRAPHIYLATAARFMPGRQVLSPEEAQAVGVHPRYFKDTSDAVLLSTRGGAVYDRTFLSALVRPGIGARNWVSRTNYPALGIVPTGATEMSLYVNQDYAQPTAHLHRYSLRLDGLASVRAEYAGGELLSRPLRFAGKRLSLNFATSAAGGVRVEIQDAQGRALRGFTLADSVEAIGNEIDRVVRWKKGDDLASLAGQTVRLRLVMKDADVFALQFHE